MAKTVPAWTKYVMENFIKEYKSRRRLGDSKSRSRTVAQFNVVPTACQYAETTIYRMMGLKEELKAALEVADKELAAEKEGAPCTDLPKLPEPAVEPQPTIAAAPAMALSQTELAMIQLMRGMQADFASMVDKIVEKKFADFLDYMTAPTAPKAEEKTPVQAIEILTPVAKPEQVTQDPDKLPRPTRPKVLIVGCLDSQFEMIKQRNKTHGIEFSCYSSQRSASHRLGAMAAAADFVIVLVDFVSHSTCEVVKIHAKEWTYCNGMFSAIDKILAAKKFFK